MINKALTPSDDYKVIFKSIIKTIENAQVKTIIAANQQTLLLYYTIGHLF